MWYVTNIFKLQKLHNVASNGSLNVIVLDKDLEEASHGLLYIIFLDRQGPMRKLWKISVKIAGSLTEFRTGILRNNIRKHYRYTSLLGEVREKQKLNFRNQDFNDLCSSPDIFRENK
jgi:hypothetical protein